MGGIRADMAPVFNPWTSIGCFVQVFLDSYSVMFSVACVSVIGCSAETYAACLEMA